MPIGFARPAVPEDRVSNQCRIDSRKNFHALEVKTNVTDCLKSGLFPTNIKPNRRTYTLNELKG
jgi:hypothetical protein